MEKNLCKDSGSLGTSLTAQWSESMQTHYQPRKDCMEYIL